MNRRTSIKGIFAVSLIGISSFSFYRWLRIRPHFDLIESATYRELIADLAEVIIPETDSPGAKRAGVEKYIVNVMTNCKTSIEQNKFFTGLQDVEEYSLSNFGQSFTKCNLNDKSTILKYFSERDVYSFEVINKMKKKVFGETFFLQLKQLTIEGYCQSEIGARQGLRYDYIPVNYEPCIPWSPGQKSWATK